jgi:hypothetical protein
MIKSTLEEGGNGSPKQEQRITRLCLEGLIAQGKGVAGISPLQIVNCLLDEKEGVDEGAYSEMEIVHD